MIDAYIDFDYKTHFKFESYDLDYEYKFPKEGNYHSWKYDYTFKELAPEDVSEFDNLVKNDIGWTKTANGYGCFQKDENSFVDIDVDVTNKRLVLIHGIDYSE